MKKCLLAIFLILGTVIGSGFSSGKEIVVFFTRFGFYSFLFIPIAFVLFYFVFYLLMTKGQQKLINNRNSKIVSILMILCCTIFSSSMFAGIQNCADNVSMYIKIFLFALIFLLCFFACFKKLNFLSVTNLILIPVLLIILIVFFFFAFPSSSFIPVPKQNVFVGLGGGAFFCVLYIVLNISLSSIVIAKSGEGMTKKQIKFASLFSALTLSVFILLVNVLVICNYDVVSEEMPLLALSSGVFSILLRFVIMVGCLTTLLSDIFIASSSCKRLNFNDVSIFIICTLLPFAMSSIGFSSIVSWLYPTASLVGVVLLFLLFARRST